jgi:hypothetical protein
MTLFKYSCAFLFGALLTQQVLGDADAKHQHGKASPLRRENEQSTLAIFNQFKERNQLKDDFDVGAKVKDIVGGSFSSLGGEMISTKRQDLDPISDIFAEGATYYLDGVQQAIPAPAVFRSNNNPLWTVTMTGDRILQATKTDPSNAEMTINLVSVMPGLSDMLVEIHHNDLDENKLEKFKLEEDHSRRSLRKFEKMLTHQKHLRSLQGPCQEFRVIEVASKSDYPSNVLASAIWYSLTLLCPLLQLPSTQLSAEIIIITMLPPQAKFRRSLS